MSRTLDSIWSAAALVLAVFVGGCSMFRADRSSIYDVEYGAARDDINRVRQASYEDEDEDRSIWDFGLDDLSPEKLTADAKKAVGQGPNKEVAERLLAEAKSLYDQAAADPQSAKAAFGRAGGRFASAAERWPDSSLQEEALFYAGKSYFFADRYHDANEAYEKLIKFYPSTKYLDLAEAHRFSIAQYWLNLDEHDPESFYEVNMFDQSRPWRDKRGHAIRIFNKIRLDDPTGKLADDAALAAANAHFADGDFFRADQDYTDLRQAYPRSEHQFTAHFLGVRAKLASYDGPDYSGKPLDDAEDLIKQMRKRFPQECDQHHDEIARAFAEVRYRQAERVWTEARYYDLRREFGAARIRYRALLEKYDDTPFAERARERIADTSDQPDVPPQRLAWLVNLFPPDDPLKLEDPEDKSNFVGRMIADMLRQGQQEEAEYAERATGETLR